MLLAKLLFHYPAPGDALCTSWLCQTTSLVGAQMPKAIFALLAIHLNGRLL